MGKTAENAQFVSLLQEDTQSWKVGKACQKLKPSVEEKDALLTYLTKKVFANKLVSHDDLSNLKPAAQLFSTSELLAVNQSLEKALLRAPEATSRVLQFIGNSQPDDGLNSLLEACATPLLNVMRNSNDSIRQDALEAFKSLCKPTLSLFTVSNVANQIAKALNAKIPIVEHRLLTLQALASLPTNDSALQFCLGYLSTNKEPNEACLQVALDAVIHHATTKESIHPHFVSMVSNPKTTLVSRKQHIQHLTSAESLEKTLLDITNKFQSLGISAVAKEGKDVSVGEAIAALQLILNDAQHIIKDEKSFLYNDKIYNKAIGTDLKAIVDCTLALIAHPIAKEAPVDSLAQLVAFCGVNNPDANLRKRFLDGIKAMSNPLVATLASKAVSFLPTPETQQLAYEAPVIYSDATLGSRAYRLLHNALASSTSPPLQDLLFPAHSSILTSSIGPRAWDKLVNGKDVSSLEDSKFIDFILKRADSKEVPALATLLRLFPHQISHVVPWILSGISDPELTSITTDDLLMYVTPDGELAFDPLPKKKVADAPKTKDEKWEAELKKELAGKSTAKPVVKRSKEEQELMDRQLALERTTRAKIAAILPKHTFTWDVLDAVLQAAEEMDDVEQMDVFLQPLVTALIQLLKPLSSQDSNKAILAGQRVVDAYCALGNVAGWQIGKVTTPPLLAMATLRHLGVPFAKVGESDLASQANGKGCLAGIPPGWTGVSLDTLSNRVLDNLQAVTIPPSTFSYVFPFLDAVCESKDLNHVEKALDIMHKHTLDFTFSSSPLLPANQLLSSLFSTLERYPARFGPLCREAIIQLCQGLQETSSTETLNVLLDKTLHPEASVREAASGALRYIIPNPKDKPRMDVLVWMAMHAPDEQATTVWGLRNGESTLDKQLIPELLQLVVHPVSAVRMAAASSLVPLRVPLGQIIEMYRQELLPPKPILDEFGQEIKIKDRVDIWQRRSGLAQCLKALAPSLQTEEEWRQATEFYITHEALGDKNETVRIEMREALVAMLHAAPDKQALVKTLLPLFDSYLSSPAKNSEKHDRIRESVVVALGTLSQYLEPSDKHVSAVVQQLVETLKTPSESVQMAVAECLPALVKNMPDSMGLVEMLLDHLFSAKDYAQRRGFAFGLAGAIKGRGVGTIKEMGLISTLKEAAEDKKTWEKREAAVLAFETMAITLGRLFEPYVVQILPIIVPCFGDGKSEVREATWDASKAIMGKISAHGVKLLLPSLLKGLDDSNWRSKVGSIELLGSMAFLAPKQLTTSLPVIVPRLCEVLTDSHSKVQESARSALVHFGEVIKNPEVASLVPILLAALVDPNSKTLAALNALLETAFVHYIDAPSLALIVPIVRRGLRERGTDSKKKAAQILGSMATLTNPKDLTPYARELLPELHTVLVDPVPEVRSVAAKALGLIVHKLGEENFGDVIPGLMDVLNSDTAGVDRFGAAQGLAEVLSGLGLSKLEELLPEIIAATKSPKAYTRESFITLLVYLPATFRERYVPYLPSVIPPILRGLADESEAVRDASLKAGQMIVRNYSTNAIDLLLPVLEEGILDDNWRIRQSSTILLGDLMFRIMGVSGKTALDHEDGQGTEHGRRMLQETLGKDKYDQVLARIAIVRNDANALVRQTASQVWKSIVSNTPRTTKEIMPVLMDIIIESLSSESEEKKSVAARTLGDLVRKMGESIVLEILPIFEQGLESDDAIHRQGVCYGMREVLASAGKSSIVVAADRLSPLVRKALIDSEPNVREAAASAFNLLHSHIGGQAVDDVIPGLLGKLKSNRSDAESTRALEALREILSVRAQAIIPQLLPTLLERPIEGLRARALIALVGVASQHLGRRLHLVVPALLEASENDQDSGADESLETLLSDLDDDGLHQLHTVMVENIHPDAALAKRVATCKLLAILFAQSVDYSVYIGDWLLTLLPLLASDEVDLVKAAWAALDSLSKGVAKDEQDRYVKDVRRGIQRATDKWKKTGRSGSMPGLSLPKSLAPMLSFYLQGLMYSQPDVREVAASGLAELVGLTDPEHLKPFVTQLAGALIRVSGERMSPEVKTGLLSALEALLVRVPANLKPFLPQLQRTFTKAMSEPGVKVRNQASKCIAVVAPMMPRLDPLVTELVACLKGADKSVKISVFQTLGELPISAVTEAGRAALRGALMEGLQNDSDEIRASASRALNNHLKTCPQDAMSIFQEVPRGSDYASLHALAQLVADPCEWMDDDVLSNFIPTIVTMATHEKSSIAEPAIESISWIAPKMPTADLMDALLLNMSENRASELRKASCDSLGSLVGHLNVVCCTINVGLTV
jgi:HEAT repeat protein